MSFAPQTAAWLLPEVGWVLPLRLKRDCIAHLLGLFLVTVWCSVKPLHPGNPQAKRCYW